MKILLLTPDIMFSTRIRSALTRAGHEIQLVESDDPALLTGALDQHPALAILDIGAFGWPWETLLQRLRERDGTLPLLAYGSHVDVDSSRRATALGATRVVARSTFVNEMAALVARYGSTGKHGA